jgi:hypothetical protein
MLSQRIYFTAANILPPPHNLTLPIVQLMGHPTYRAYQAHTAALSLFPKLYVKFLPPTWNAPTPPTPPPNASFENTESKEKKEWKRRIKMYRKFLEFAVSSKPTFFFLQLLPF